MKRTFSTRFLAAMLCVLQIVIYLPGSITSADPVSTSIADPKTLSNWTKWFPAGSSRYAGGIYVDKSVYTATEAKSDSYFSDIHSSLNFGKDKFGNENFLVALSAIGSNSEVFGYAYLPTDTVIVLDASTSMGTGGAASSSIDDMVAGANEAAKRLLALNHYNRVSVVIYNGSSNVLLPLDSYSVTTDLLTYQRPGSTNRIYVSSGVRDGNGNTVAQSYISQASGTYTQGGIYAAAQQLLNADTVIEDGKIQGGTKRIPIMVLMSDGEPSYRTTTSSGTTIDKYNAATNSNADRSNFREDEVTAFSTMLTAAWAESEVSAHYDNDMRFYTLGYNLSSGHQYAQNVLNPMDPNNALASLFSGYATQYLALAQGATGVIRDLNNNIDFRVKRASSPALLTSLDYVDRYWQAAQASQLSSAFESIVNEIIIQSRYYSTYVASQNYESDGFISFTDEIGSYMDVKNIKGLYIGDGKLVSGGMFAEFATKGTVSVPGYTAADLQGFENKVLAAVSERFSITLSQASQLIEIAKAAGFISYTSASNFSNYIAWYADANNGFIAPYTGSSDSAPANAKYIVRSYFYMGDVTQNHVETSMLHMLVRVREEIATGRQIVDMNLPAALIPMVTYTINVNGDVLTDSSVTGLIYSAKKPISLLFEVGLSDDITPVNITEKVTESFRKDSNGNYTFYTNRWRDDTGNPFVIDTTPDNSIFNHGKMYTSVSQYIPSLENQRMYYTENAQIFDSSHNVYTGAKPAAGGEYYTQYKWVEGDSSNAVVKTAYNRISEEILNDPSLVIQLSGKAGWFVKKGTPQFHLVEDVQRDHATQTDKSANTTGTLVIAEYPIAVHHVDAVHDEYHLVTYHGNNGLVKATPAQGIKLSKTVSQTVSGAPSEFSFEIELSGAPLPASCNVYRVKADSTTTTETVSIVAGKINVTLADGDVVYIYDLPNGSSYTVTEAYSQYYSASSINASGTIPLHTFAEVDFVNSPKGYGSLLVGKDVTHPFEAISPEIELFDFDITVEMTGDDNDLAQIVVSGIAAPDTSVSGKYVYSFALKNGHDVLFTNIPEGVTYKVAETSLPAGFTLVTPSAQLQGEIVKDTQSEALLVNDYDPSPVSPNVIIAGEKNINGRAWDNAIDHYQVALQQVSVGGHGTVAVGAPVIVNVVKSSGSDYTIDMSGISYEKPGIYTYVVHEILPANPADKVADISYDATIAIFTVTVADHGTGSLSVDDVIVYENSATLTGDAVSGWIVNKDFTNHYMSTTVRFPAYKVVTEGGFEINQHRGGILFALYSSVSSTDAFASALTDDSGVADFIIPVKQSEYSTVKYYYLREVIPPVDLQVVGMTYDDSIKYVVAIDWSTGAQPTVTYYHYDPSAANGLGSVISDIAAEPLEITNTYDDNVVSTPTVDLSGKKTVNGAALRAGDVFTFDLFQTGADFNTSGLTPIQTVNVDYNTFNGEFNFNGVTFDTEGTKYLVVSERAGTIPGITYDTTRYHVTVNVTKALDGKKTILNANITHVHQVGNGDVTVNALNFDNKYTVNGNEEVIVNGSKVLVGRDIVESEFVFGLYEDGNSTPLYTVRNNADGKFVFPALTYSYNNVTGLNETMTYVIKEIIPGGSDLKGITYNSDGKVEYELVVNLKDNGQGGITKTVTLDGSPVTEVNVAFENTYAATGTSVTFSGEKSYNRTGSYNFDFNLFETGSDFAVSSSAVPAIQTAVVTGGTGNYSFTLNYTMADRGYHYYVLEESIPAVTNGTGYDTTKYYITINVLDNGHGEMEAHVMSSQKAFTSESVAIDELDFTNIYSVAGIEEVIISGQKTLIGKTLDVDEFSFGLFEEGSATPKYVVTNDSNGNFVFPTLTYTAPKTETYIVKEVVPSPPSANITYDTTEYTVVIKVEDDGIGGLKKTVTYSNNHTSDNVTVAGNVFVTFKNTYTVTGSTNVTLSGIKTISGRNFGPGESFTFELYKAAGSSYAISSTPVDTAVMDTLTHEYEFILNYGVSDVGNTYYYVIKEQGAGNTVAGLTYSNKEYKIKVEVVDNGGTVDTVVTVEDGTDKSKLDFENTYAVTGNANVTLSGEKTINGRPFNAGESFTFELYEATASYA
ncbi:MAG: hypothetical protein E7665_10785, partial [Ruminococcaceae bacterium]|nr:hypothetical protein [Oscillospiraceae bacterium]